MTRETIERAAARNGVPGAVVGLLAGGHVEVVATGVRHAGDGGAVTAATPFQLGSLTKAYTATAVLRLADEGRLDLDRPVVDVLPDFAVADRDATARVTPRHLLAHTSGIGGDDFADTGDGDDCVSRYVARLAGVGQDAPCGQTMSYSNAGYVVLGRMVEAIAGAPWDAALRALLLDPLRLDGTVTRRDDALALGAAWGHVTEDGEARPAPFWSVASRALGPAGGICATAGDVLRFAALHLGAEPSILSPEAAAAMRRPQVDVPDRWTTGTHWGLGWILDRRDGGHAVWGHDGDTGVQRARLRVVPDQGVALVALVNGGDLRGFWDDVVVRLPAAWRALADSAPPRPADRAPTDGQAARVVGSYERLGMRIDIARDGTELRAVTSIRPPLRDQLPMPVPDATAVVRAADAAGAPDGVYLVKGDGDPRWSTLVVFDLDGERYLHTGARALRAVPVA